jgi:endonuclease/exonuclease/phosphatase family metal-dependent hydrolase
MRRSLATVLVGFLVVAGLQAQPAAAASKKPSKVGLVSFVKADYDRRTNTTSLSLDWPDARGAKKYEIFVSRYYSMKKAKVYRQKSSKTTIKKLVRGKDYFFQVRGVNGKKHGSKSSTVGRTTILRPGPSQNLLPVRVMTYNVCSDVCDVLRTTPNTWQSSRQLGVLERVAASGADVVAMQEAGKLSMAPPGYTEAISYSAKRLFYKTARFEVAAGPKPTATFQTTGGKCRLTSETDRPTGVVFLGRHSGGCRYAVWAQLVDRSTGRTFMMVDVHTVTGQTKASTDNRRAEVNELLAVLKLANPQRLPVVYAGDFNSHKQTRTSDSPRPVMNARKFYDAYDLARRVSGQHMNSYNAFRRTPIISTKWGDHIDKVWVDPWRTRVDGWYNFALLGSDGKLVDPIPSDHSPVVVDLRIG